jgi:hypothetical protein
VSARGHYIGKIIDDLDAIASQVDQRCKLGQTDLNRVLEDFFKELLNLIYDANLKNLNSKRSNEPGLDLGDSTSPTKRAFQVTSQASAAKVNKTLDKITKEQLDTYDEIYVLIIGKRQKSYALNAALVKKCGFDERNILGITELCRDIMQLEMDGIRAVQEKLAAEQRQIRIELEPEIDGKFATTIHDLVERRPSVQRSDCTILVRHSAGDGLFESASEAKTALNAFIDELQKLPRLTREFFGWIVDNSDLALGVGGEGRQINADYVSKMRPDEVALMADLRLLQAWDFLDYDQDETHKSGYFSFSFPGAYRTNLPEAFTGFIAAEGLSAASMFSTMNFTAFGPAPVPKSMPSAKRKSKSKVKKPRG